MRVLLLSAYDAQSHRHWQHALREGLADWEWASVGLPPRYFSWRVRGNALTFSELHRADLAGRYDTLLATSMVDLATLRGLVPGLAGLPTALYFHENQFAYPEGKGRHGLVEAQITSIYSALAADRLLFNSAYNRDTFLAGCAGLLSRLPDGVPGGLPERLAAKSELLPVPVAALDGDARTARDGDPGGPLQVVWNHRWEYDKGPEALLEIARGLARAGVDCRLHIVGQQFRQRPEPFTELKTLLTEAGLLGSWGYLEDRGVYAQLLKDADIALSTAEHDFQGLSVIEACAAGATPLVPDRLVYPEWVAGRFRYDSVAAAVTAIAEYARLRSSGQALPRQDVDAFSPAVLMPRYRSILQALAA